MAFVLICLVETCVRRPVAPAVGTMIDEKRIAYKSEYGVDVFTYASIGI